MMKEQKNLIEFFKREKMFISVNDLKGFLKPEFLNEDIGLLMKNSSEIPELIITPMKDLNDCILDGRYILKNAKDYNNGNIICIVDEVNRFILVNELKIASSMDVLSKELNIDEDLIKCLKKIICFNVDEVKEEYAIFNDKILANKLGDYNIVGFNKIYHEFKKDIDEYILNNIDVFIKEANINIGYLENEVEISAKQLFIEKYNYEKQCKDLIDCKTIIYYMKDYRKHVLPICLYNYYINNYVFMDYLKDFLKKQIKEKDGIKFFKLREIYILEKSKKLLDRDKDIYEEDEVLTKMREITRSLKCDMKTINVNGEKVKNNIVFNFNNGTMFVKKDKSWENVVYNLNDELEIKYGKRVLVKC